MIGVFATTLFFVMMSRYTFNKIPSRLDSVKIVPITSGADDARSLAMSAVMTKSDSPPGVLSLPTRGHIDVVLLLATGAGVVEHM